MSFAYVVKVKYKEGYELSVEQLGAFLTPQYSNHIPSTVPFVCYIDCGRQVTLIFWEHDNEEFMAADIAEKLVCVPDRFVHVMEIDWGGLDRHLSEDLLSRVSKRLKLDEREE